MKRILVEDQKTGDILTDVTFSGQYNITYTDDYDGGKMRMIKTIENGKYGDNHWIKNMWYKPIALRLADKFRELKHVPINRILFIEDINYEDTGKAKDPWMARCKKANKDFMEMTGYEYIIETRSWYIERMQPEQVAALIYHELMHIDTDGNLRKHSIEDWGHLVASLGHDWATTKATIKDILDESFEGWSSMPTVATQLTLFREMKRSS
ncbi:MAG: putative metallopeptidase [Cellulosilyticaceae bacterium]